MPGQPKHFITIGISIVAMAMLTFNTIRITQLNEEINTLKEKTDLILDVVHLHETLAPPGRETGSDQQALGRSAGVKHLVLFQGD
jgi:hypothetical protein